MIRAAGLLALGIALLSACGGPPQSFPGGDGDRPPGTTEPTVRGAPAGPTPSVAPPLAATATDGVDPRPTDGPSATPMTHPPATPRPAGSPTPTPGPGAPTPTAFPTATPLATATPVSLARLAIGQVAVHGTRFIVDIADENKTRARGLGGIAWMPDDRGMLFVYPGDVPELGFWMLDTLIPLDMIWISSDLHIVHIAHQVQPEPGVMRQDLTIYTPPGVARYVLELNGGTAEHFGIAVGDPVTLELP